MRTGPPTTPPISTPPVATTGDAELVRRAQEHPGAFAPLYLTYRDRVLTYCAYRLADPAEAEDAASAIFVKALHALPDFRDPGDGFRSWLFRIAHNEVVDRLKRAGRGRDAALDLAESVADPRPSPEEAAVAAEAAGRLRALLSTLPPRERSVMELRLADLTAPEISTVLGIGEQSVWTAQSRALARLRTAMAAEREVRRDG